MRTLVIPENPTLDQYVLKPVVERIFADLERKCRVDVLKDPYISGVSQALSAETIGEVLARYPMIDLFLLVVDRDCEESRENGAVAARVAQAAALGKSLVGCLAIEEVETWALALFRDEVGGRWQQIRAECHPKEAYFEPLVKHQGWETMLGRGRVEAMKKLPGNWKALKQRCLEIQELQDAIESWLFQS